MALLGADSLGVTKFLAQNLMYEVNRVTVGGPELISARRVAPSGERRQAEYVS